MSSLLLQTLLLQAANMFIPVVQAIMTRNKRPQFKTVRLRLLIIGLIVLLKTLDTVYSLSLKSQYIAHNKFQTFCFKKFKS